MAYNLEINGEATSLTVTPQEAGRLTIVTPENQYEVDCRRIDRHHLLLTVAGTIINAFVSGDDEAKQILIDGVAYTVADRDARAPTASSNLAPRQASREVTPPMPSVVVKVLVAEGEPVQQGDNLVVVSAMKMETTLTAPFDARVARINCAAGDKVAPGDVLVDLDAGEEN
ncbi:MAG: biotin/lipoyl-binding protein [Desulfobacterales bacterium]|jgi:acetyl/propionyl-CoA carboxylase alpha subunit